MKRLLLAMVLAGWAVAALAFPVDLELQTNGLDVYAEVDQIGNQAIVRLTNGESFPVRCDAVFRNGPEQPRTRRATIGPGETRPLTFAPRRTVVRVRVEVWCESVASVAPAD